MMKRYKWISNIYLTGRSSGHLVIEDPDGKARSSTLETIDRTVTQELRQFQDDLRDRYGES